MRYADDRHKQVHLVGHPARVVSLVPSDTHLVATLGGAHLLVGRTRYCVEPVELAPAVVEVGGTKDADVERVLALRPDLVLANREENTRSIVERLEAAGVPVYVSFPQTVSAGLAHAARLARVLGLAKLDQAKARLAEGYRALKEAQAATEPRPRVPTFCPIWMSPLMTIHGSTFLSDALLASGADNVFADRERRYPLAADIGQARPLTREEVIGRDVRYPRVTLDEVEARRPELIVLPDEPYEFTDDDVEVFRAIDTPASRAGRVVRVSGRDLMWPGLRSLEGLERIRAVVDAARGAA